MLSFSFEVEIFATDTRRLLFFFLQQLLGLLFGETLSLGFLLKLCNPSFEPFNLVFDAFGLIVNEFVDLVSERVYILYILANFGSIRRQCTGGLADWILEDI